VGEVKHYLLGEVPEEAIRDALAAKHRLHLASGFPPNAPKGTHAVLLLDPDDFLLLLDTLYYAAAYRTGKTAAWALAMRGRVMWMLGIKEG
jgi:hypothetical protein